MNTLSTLSAVSRFLLGHRSDAKAGSANKPFRHGVRSVDELFQSHGSDLEPHARRWLSTTRSYVRAHPAKSLALVVAIGMAMRQILRR